MSRMFNRIVQILMPGVVIYVYIIQVKVKIYEMHGKMLKQCLMEEIENDQHQHRQSLVIYRNYQQ